ncbi:MAG: ORF6N domain-containing protein, partial [Desulfobacterales bacterium]|nr:ORF6N domain-containing protein [Desulfobacterales bacterium]
MPWISSILDFSNVRVYLIRGIKVMLDRDLAELYVVETKILKRAVKRNIDRFPNDFMFELSKKE